MPLWRQSFSGGVNESATQQDVGGEKGQLKAEGSNGIQPMSVPLRQLVSRSPPTTDSKPTLQLHELRVDGAGQVNCPPTAPYAALSCSELLPNAKEPYVFENDFVRGKLLFLLNPAAMVGEPPSDPTNTLTRTELFEGKNRLFWVQLQLQFKQTPPEGSVLYIGGEVPRAMHLGFFTGRGCNLLLSILRSLVRGLHYSFGESDDSKAHSEDAELPHISFPLYTAVDQFVCTPAGHEPPALGSADFGESKEDAAQRRRSGASGAAYAFNTTDTYSFHFHSYYIDFLHWQVTNVPGMKATDLRVFWEDMPLHLAAYFISPTPADAGQELPVHHSRRVKKYQFCFQLSHARRQPQQQLVDSRQEPHRLSAVNFQIPAEAPDIYARLEEIQRQITKYEVHVPAWFEYLSCSRTNRERRVGYVVVVREYVDEPPTRDEEEPKPSRRGRKKRKTPRKDRKTTNERVLLLPALAAFAPLSFLEHRDHSQVKKKKSDDSVFAASSITVRSRRGKFEKIEGEREFLDYYIQLLVTPFAEVIAGDGSGSRSEYASSCGSDSSSSSTPQPEQLYAAQRALLEMVTTASSLLSLENEWPYLSANAGPHSASTFMFSSSSITSGGRNFDLSAPPSLRPGAVHVVRVLSSTQWRHEWLMLDESNRMLRFSRPLSNNSANKFAILLDQVVGVSTLDPTFRRCSCTSSSSASDSASTSPLYWLHIGKVARCHHLAFVSPEARRPWLELLSRLIDRARRIPRSVLTVSPDTFGGKQFVLNDCSPMQLATITASQLSTCLLSSGCVMNRPLDLVSSALKRALKLITKSQTARSRYSVDPDFVIDLLAFQDHVQALQRVDLLPLARSEGNRLVFFLNMYHLMVVHASLLGLAPKSKTQWGRFFNGASYRLGVSDKDPSGLLFSLAEIEHCILRASMASLRFPLASLVIPRFNERSDPRACLTLRSSDFRINFALNCMTYSCSDRVPVYDRMNLDAQLDEATRQVVTRVLRYDEKTRVVYLPKSCDWYRGDFATAADVDPNASHDELDNASLGVLLPYASKEHAKMLEYAWRHPYGLIQRYEYVPYDFRFRDALALDDLPPPAPTLAHE
ncbi:hypothetical protein PF008_g7649 [Phytophthora fragariae]|uniref:Uncharacterized protein n=1 Tax=Phytophthora fragariae TaxID=53985 RepID=A0A6G0S2H0_9STRA|nr:hypothetical protein PF008_g7649 [Phytophthora fragariae]